MKKIEWFLHDTLSTLSMYHRPIIYLSSPGVDRDGKIVPAGTGTGMAPSRPGPGPGRKQNPGRDRDHHDPGRDWDRDFVNDLQSKLSHTILIKLLQVFDALCTP